MNTLKDFDLQLFADGDGGGTGAGDGGNPPANTPPAGNEPPANTPPGAPPTGNPPAPTPNNTILGGNNDPANPPNNTQNQQTTIPESYNFASIIPEGMQQDEQATREFSDIAKKCGLNQDQASEIAKYGIDFSQRAIDQINQGYQQMVTGWGDKAKQELGNDFQSVVSNAGKGIEALEKQIPGLRQALNETGVGNRVEFIKAFSLLGQLVGEDNFRGFNGVVPHKDTLYPNTNFGQY